MRGYRIVAGIALVSVACCLQQRGANRAATATAGPLVTVTAVNSTPGNPPRVTAHVTVTESTGVPIRGLPPDSFQVTEDGRPVKNVRVDSAPSQTDPLSVALALDTSGSMSGQPLSDMKAAARAFVETLAPQDQVTLISFGPNVAVRVPLTDNRDALFGAIDALGIIPLADTPLNDGAFAAVNEVATRPSGRRAVLVMTDGEDTNSNKTLDDAIKRAQDTNVPVFVVGLGKVTRGPLDRLAATTGGTFTEVPSSDQLTATFTEIAAQLREEYVVEFDAAPRNQDETRELQLAVNVRGQTSPAVARVPIAASISRHVTPSFITPTDGQRVRGDVRIAVNVTPEVSAREVKFYVDDVLIDTVTAVPFETTWRTKAVLTGGHILRADATGVDGRSESVQIPITLAAASGGVPWELGVIGSLIVLGVVGVAMVIGRMRHPPVRDVAASVPAAMPAAQGADGVWVPAPLVAAQVGGAAVGGAATAVALGPGTSLGWLIEVRPDGTRWEWPLRSEETLIGREVSNPHILLDDPDVSRVHASVSAQNGDLVYTDLAPTNPTLINGRPYTAPHRLQDGDVLTVGGVQIYFTQALPAT